MLTRTNGRTAKPSPDPTNRLISKRHTSFAAVLLPQLLPKRLKISLNCRAVDNRSSSPTGRVLRLAFAAVCSRLQEVQLVAAGGGTRMATLRLLPKPRPPPAHFVNLSKNRLESYVTQPLRAGYYDWRLLRYAASARW